MLKRGNKGALQLSIGTIVIIVLAMSMLILGMVLIQKIMCAGMNLTDKVSESASNEIKDLFQSREHGVKCMGQEGQEVTLGSGGYRGVGCVINTNEEKEYKISIDKVEAVAGIDDRRANEWLVEKGGDRISVSPGDKKVTVGQFDIPQDAPDSRLKIIYQVEDLTDGGEDTIPTYVDVENIGSFTANIC